MGIFDFLSDALSSATKQSGNDSGHTLGAIDYGKQKKDGSHDHRYNTENDRTRAQQEGDKKRRK